MVIMLVLMKDVSRVLVVWVVLDRLAICTRVSVNVNLVLVEGKFDFISNGYETFFSF